MKIGARLQAVMDLIDQYNPDLGPLDEYTNTYLRQRRYIGSKDRRHINKELFAIYRVFPLLQKVIEQVALGDVNGRTLVLAYLRWHEKMALEEIQVLFTGQQYQPSVLSQEEQACLSVPLEVLPSDFPDWLFEKLSNAFKEETAQHLAALNQQASVDLCINTHLEDRDTVLKELSKQGVEGTQTPYSPFGIRLQKRIDLRSLELFRKGIVDIQDEGAQLISLLCDPKPGMTVCDYCAGAGGKTRTLSILMGHSGAIVATDQDADRLAKLQARLRPSQYQDIKVHPLSEVHEHFSGKCDRVLLDVPCSGTGRLRRQVELKMALTPEKLDSLIRLQHQILTDAAHLVKPQGYLIYATCSLLPEENESQIEWFLKNNPDFKQVPANSILSSIVGQPIDGCDPSLSLTPYTHSTDGFFAAVLQKM